MDNKIFFSLSIFIILSFFLISCKSAPKQILPENQVEEVVEVEEDLPVPEDGVVYFDFDEFFLDDKYTLDRESVLYQFLDYLMEAEDNLFLEGHADLVGSEEYNLRLSLKRSQAVRDFFTNNGINEDRIEVDSFGEIFPINEDIDDEEGQGSNRRVELFIVP